MKKITLALLTGLASFNLQAKEQFWCDYVDYFHLSQDSNPWIMISARNANRDVRLQVISPRTFEVRDAGNCNAGYSQVTFSYDKTHWCILDIKDGPTMWHPTVTATCNGLSYNGTDYDGDHSYTINIK